MLSSSLAGNVRREELGNSEDRLERGIKLWEQLGMEVVQRRALYERNTFEKHFFPRRRQV